MYDALPVNEVTFNLRPEQLYIKEKLGEKPLSLLQIMYEKNNELIIKKYFTERLAF